MEESTQLNVPVIDDPNNTGTGFLLPFCTIQQLFFFFLPDLKLVHSSEKTNIERPGFTLQSLCLSLCWGWGGVMTVGGFLEHTIDSVGNYEVHVLS